MYKIKYVFLILIFSFHAVSAENLLASKKNIKDILLDISEKIEGLEKTFLLPDNGFIEDGEASTALIELDILRIKLKKLEGELEKIEYELASQINSINETLGTGTLIATPSSLPFREGIISPIAFDAPVEVGTID